MIAMDAGFVKRLVLALVIDVYWAEMWSILAVEMSTLEAFHIEVPASDT